jgi:hypothetical protein
MKLASLVKNKYFCYLTYALMVINLLGYVSVGSMECVVVFTLATFFCKGCLSKNMCLCIFGGLFVSNILFGCSKVKEGFEASCTDLSESACGGNNACEYKDEKCEKKKVEASAVVADAEKAVADAEEDAADGDDTGDTGDDDTGIEDGDTFRNMRRHRKRAVREAFTTIRKAIRSY